MHAHKRGIGTIYFGFFILLLILTLKATQWLMREIILIMRVSVRNNAEALISHIMRDTW